jgi:hypothetical protein
VQLPLGNIPSSAISGLNVKNEIKYRKLIYKLGELVDAAEYRVRYLTMNIL